MAPSIEPSLPFSSAPRPPAQAAVAARPPTLSPVADAPEVCAAARTRTGESSRPSPNRPLPARSHLFSAPPPRSHLVPKLQNFELLPREGIVLGVRDVLHGWACACLLSVRVREGVSWMTRRTGRGGAPGRRKNEAVVSRSRLRERRGGGRVVVFFPLLLHFSEGAPAPRAHSPQLPCATLGTPPRPSCHTIPAQRPGRGQSIDGRSTFFVSLFPHTPPARPSRRVAPPAQNEPRPGFRPRPGDGPALHGHHPGGEWRERRERG